MSIRNLIESAIKGDALSFNETFTSVMGESAVQAVEDIKNPTSLEDVIEVLLNLGVVTVEEMEAEDFTEETLLELSKKTLKSYVKKAATDTYYRARDNQYSDDDNIENNLHKVRNHEKGTHRAVSKLTKAKSGDAIKKHATNMSHIAHDNIDADDDEKGIDKLDRKEKSIHKAVDKIKEETQLDELSKKTLTSYKNKAIKDKEDHEYNRDSSSNPAVKKHFNNQVQKRSAGLKNVKKRLGDISKFEENEVNGEEVEQIDELSASTLGSYVAKASRKSYMASTMSKTINNPNTSKTDDMHKYVLKRKDGIEKAAGKLMDKKD